MKHLLPALFVIALSSVHPNPAFAHSTPSTSVTDADLHALSQAITWRRLLFYPDGQQESTLSNNKHNTHFFISGRFDDPHAELVANIAQLSNPATREQFICQFPARSHWLLTQLPHLKNVSGTEVCAEFEAWATQIDAKVLTLIHAEEHINRMGSFFAHTLVKIDNTKSLASHSSDDAYFFNFATDERFESNTLRTIRGRNPAAMTIDKFTEKQASYLIRDERDLWYFTIDLSQDDIDQIIRHLWETKNLGRFYNFFDNNCASEILRLIDVANPKYQLIKEAGKIIAPIDVGRLLATHGLLKSEVVQPSWRTLLAHDIAMSEHDYKAVMTDNRLPAINKPNNNPLLASPTHRIHISATDSNLTDTTYTLGFRGAYQDLLDRSTGKRQFIHTNIAQIDMMYDDKIKLKNATLIDFLAFNPKNAPLPKASYGGHVKLDTVHDRHGDDHLVLSVGKAHGASWVIGNNSLCYTLGTGTAQLGNLDKGYRIGVGLQAGCAHHLNEQWRVTTETKLPLWYQEDLYVQPSLSLATQYDLSKTLGIRLSADYEKLEGDDKKSIQLGMIRYFD